MSGHYVIKNQSTGLVLEGGSHGNHVTLTHKHGGHNQPWHDDHSSGTIRCRENEHLCLDIEGDHLVLHPHQPHKHDQEWERKGNTIVSRHDSNMVLGVAGCGTKVVKAPLHSAHNHHWVFEHC